MPDSNMQSSNVILLDDVDKMPLHEAITRVREHMVNVMGDLYKITEITQCDLTDDDRELMNDYLTDAFGDWQAAVQGSLEEVAYVFGEAAGTCYVSWQRKQKKAQVQEAMHIGAVLPNGATVVDFTNDSYGADLGGIVLCTASGLSADPFVTWSWWVNTEGEICCSTGHYFDRLEPAVADFNKRANK